MKKFLTDNYENYLVGCDNNIHYAFLQLLYINKLTETEIPLPKFDNGL